MGTRRSGSDEGWWPTDVEPLEDRGPRRVAPAKSTREVGPSPDHEAAIGGEPSRLDRRFQRRLGRGELEPEAKLDLHSRSVAEARRLVDRFLAESRYAGRRLVLIVTGRGLHSGGLGEPRAHGAASLRQAVPDWLAERSDVRAVVPAASRHGGAGALYVVLGR